MSRRNRILVVLGTVIAALLTLGINDAANAQRPWRKNMYNPFKSSQRTYRQPSYFGRVVEQPQSTQSLSIEPIDISAGDTVKVTVATPLRLGEKVLANVPAGENHKVIKVIGPWVGIAVEEDGHEVRGWVTYRALENLK